jgi:uncharacterized phiE125 gp8 family phage protein
MNLVLTTPPTSEPVVLNDLKAHLRVTGTSEDTLIKALGKSARQFAERYQDASYLTQTWTIWLSKFPGPRRDYIKLRRLPVQSVTHIKYYDTDDAASTMGTDDYMLDDAAGRVVLKYGKQWPTETLRPAKAVEIQYVTGYTDTDALLDERGYIVDAVKQIVTHLYENREPVVIGPTTANVPLSALTLLDTDRVVFV